MSKSSTDNTDWSLDPASIDLNDPRWVTVKEASYIARVSERTIRDWVTERGDLGVELPSGRYWIDKNRLFKRI